MEFVKIFKTKITVVKIKFKHHYKAVKEMKIILNSVIYK